MNEIATTPQLPTQQDPFDVQGDDVLWFATADLPKMEPGAGLALMIECHARGLHMVYGPPGYYCIFRPEFHSKPPSAPATLGIAQA